LFRNMLFQSMIIEDLLYSPTFCDKNCGCSIPHPCYAVEPDGYLLGMLLEHIL
jgi:hypothetical protein